VRWDISIASIAGAAPPLSHINGEMAPVWQIFKFVEAN
jgi:hypothetical protein